jgi:hygromycin-B 4-O-kinase
MKRPATIAIHDVLERLHVNAENIELIGAGWWSQAYAYENAGENYVIRISNSDVDFCKGQKLYSLLHAFLIPVPKIYAIGTIAGSTHYAISARCSGCNLAQKKVSDTVAMELFKILRMLQAITVSHFNGWGLTDKNLNGLFESWNGFLLRFYNQKMDYQIETLAGNSLLSWELYEACIIKIKKLLPYLPQTKNVVHGDFGFDNVIADGDTITGVIDWGEAKLGDWLYDVAYLDFNSNDVPYGDLWKAFVKRKNLTFQNMEERLLCYKLVIGLGSVSIAAHIADEAVFEEDRRKLEKLIA